jgi:hypothetical protein
LLDGRPYSAQLRGLANDKLLELDGVIAHTRAMQSLLRKALRCECETLEECGSRLRPRDRSRR